MRLSLLLLLSSTSHVHGFVSQPCLVGLRPSGDRKVALWAGGFGPAAGGGGKKVPKEGKKQGSKATRKRKSPSWADVGDFEQPQGGTASAAASAAVAKTAGSVKSLLDNDAMERQARGAEEGAAGDASSVEKQFPPRTPAVLRPMSSAPASLQSAVAARLPSVDLSYAGMHWANADPPVLVVKDFFTPEECDRYVAMTTASSKDGGDGGDDSGSEQVESKTFSAFTSGHRKSSTWFMQYKKVPELLSKVQRLVGLSIDHFEEPQLVRYRTGDRFMWHEDALPTSQLRGDGSDGGQRLATVLVYLNDVETGGATAFQELGMSVQPEKGKALLFFPALQTGANDARTIHAGEFAMDTKYIAQIWVHESAYPAAIPAGNRQADALQLVEAYRAEHEEGQQQ